MEKRKIKNCENLHNTTYMEILKNKKIERTRSKNQKKNILFLKYIDRLKIEQSKQAGITLVALVVTIIVLLILAGVTVSLALGSNGIIGRSEYASNMYANSTKDETVLLGSMEDSIKDLGNVSDYYDKLKEVNAPQLKQGMTPVKFESGNIVEIEENDSSWYDYNEQNWANAQTEDGSLWVWIPRYAYQVQYYTDANLTTPSETKTKFGKMDIKFLIDKTDEYYNEDNTTGTAKRCQAEDETVDTTIGYTVHPAFTNESNINFRNGGWDSELPGIWVAKFEAGYANAISTGTETLNGVKVLSSDNKNTAPIKSSSVNYSNYGNVVYAPEIERKGEDSEASGAGNISARNWQDGVYGNTQTAIKYPTFQGSTYSMNYINLGESYALAKKLTEPENIYGLGNDTDSHLMKNSEWGAVAYLAQSQYGFIGAGQTNIMVNTKNLNNGGVSTTKANGNNKASVYAVTGYNNNNKEWNNGGENASTTSNITGIYDMSGGVWERTPGYIALEQTDLSRYGGEIGYNNNTLKTVSTKYTTAYKVGTSNDKQKNWEANQKIYGDGIYETSINGNTSNSSWNKDYSTFPYSSTPFFRRGGGWGNGDSAGIFAFVDNSGYSYCSLAFRAVLV